MDYTSPDLAIWLDKDSEIKALKDKVAELERALYLKDKKVVEYKGKWRMAIGEHELPTDKARKIIKRRKSTHDYSSVTECCREISKEVKLNVQTVRVLWYEKSRLKVTHNDIDTVKEMEC